MPKNSSGAADATRAAELLTRAAATDNRRALNARIAKDVMGWHDAVISNYSFQFYYDITQKGGGPYHRTPNFAGDIAAAWQVVEKMRAMGFAMTLDNERRVFACFANLGTDYQTGESGESESAPEAICRAALRAVGNAGERGLTE